MSDTIPDDVHSNWDTIIITVIITYHNNWSKITTSLPPNLSDPVRGTKCTVSHWVSLLEDYTVIRRRNYGRTTHYETHVKEREHET